VATLAEWQEHRRQIAGGPENYGAVTTPDRSAIIGAMMNRRRFLRTVSMSLLAAPLAARAQQAATVPRVGFLSALSISSMSARLEAFRKGLRELGYVDGKTIVIEERYADERGRRGSAPALSITGTVATSAVDASLASV
jgi:hypothetical protein